MRRSRKNIAALFLSGLAAATVATRAHAVESFDAHKERIQTEAAQKASGAAPDTRERVPDGRGRGILAPPWAPKVSSGVYKNGISYHGGPLILGTTNVYYIWYGNWGTNTAQTILPNLAASIGGSPYFNINTTYYNGSGTRVSNLVKFAGSATDNYSQGATLSDTAVQSIVSNAIATNALPNDTNGVYFVLTSADVKESSGFCTQYCGWHNHGLIGGKDIKYSFVGNPDQCPSACEAQSASSPNNNPGADGMASVIAHELEETVTDPQLNAWYDSRGYENADKCAWTFGTTSTASNGSKYNVTLAGAQYLIQQNWVNASGGYCSMKY
ncbi:EXORDIUM family protein [Methylocystis sp. MJC1]|jgi:hypothetical protein|uniref:hypothetical protein n=1 Tax=Methylocystis sp. MJC1 TaxID=2654282 RepID=UPI0013EA2522|nr:hypothetical protein [Methylocystis sp. MJC1]KAF2990070.1 hypothetical protein MJC1_02730 [Methylocystis sp. MJC1]MBU6527673.1 hypothetical protein [Methylocystis sp. MJC1]UZX10609.1 EXORDIUM family protein [Methylocystis sp. MJC1]